MGKINSLLMDMDNIFKKIYINYMFSVISRVEPQWRKQVHYLHSIWELAGSNIPKGELTISFAKECNNLHMSIEQYNIDQAFHMTNHDWKHELMLQVADRIIKYNDDDALLTDNVCCIETVSYTHLTLPTKA